MPDRPSLEERPVLAGILALVGVALVVGLLAGVGVLIGSKVLGLGGEDTATASDTKVTSGESLYLPTPSETVRPTGPQITLDATGPTPTSTVVTPVPESPTTSAPPEKAITLTAGQSTVAAMQQIDLSGSYPQGDGAILQVQRFENGGWAAFPVTVSVSGETFATYVQTGQGGETKFRVLDTDSGLASNEVVVTVG
ncbi:hypothetical protein [Nocardioides houyundeii]|uniref:hypothetical protein n=1 Tax=Nocardioides houyundeii TaxID=2045452 RepID=UPI000C76ECFF|nr:hypothetical protein [Nocardioides houyundeii]